MEFLKGLIFDLDGVIADTEDLHRRAYNRIFKEQGIPVVWSKQDYRDRLVQTAGAKLAGIPEVAAHPNPEAFRRELYARKRQTYLDLLNEVRLPPRPGVVELIEEALRAGVRIGAASTCAKEGAIALLKGTLGEERFSVFTTIKAGEDAERRKPAPDIYLMAIEGLGLPASQCAAVEDSVHGMESALSAGLFTLVTPSEYTVGEDFSAADWVLPDLSHPDFSLDSLDRRLSSRREKAA